MLKGNSAVSFNQIEPNLFELFSDRQTTAENKCLLGRSRKAENVV